MRTAIQRPVRVATLVIAALLFASGAAVATMHSAEATPVGSSPNRTTTGNVKDVCGTRAPGRGRCFAKIRTDVHGGRGVRHLRAANGARTGDSAPAGFGPADLRSAYRLPGVGGEGQTIAVVDAGDVPTAEADLAVYRATYGLPPCTTANGCFRKANQSGAASPLPRPPEIPEWAVETALDLDMASASCPSCHLLLVESNTDDDADLAAAVDTAAVLGATVISNSYGDTESNDMAKLQHSYQHPGVAVVAATGDSGFKVPSFPAVFPSVIAVGGTTLAKADNTRGWTETAYDSAGSGCSAWIAKPSWQHDPNCLGRTVADVSAVADPETGVAVYSTTDSDGWIVGGGTSAAAPIIAGVIALAGNPARHSDASYLYANAKDLNDVVGGTTAGRPISDISDCGGDYLCTALVGYDGPTGNGTPNGLGAF